MQDIKLFLHDLYSRVLQSKGWLRLLRWAGMLAGAVLPTLAAQLSTLPAVIAYYGQLPLLATLGNLVIVPIILAGMYLAVAALLAG